MESVGVVTHRNLAPNHPVFRLLAPHFHCTMAIDKFVPFIIKVTIVTINKKTNFLLTGILTTPRLTIKFAYINHLGPLTYYPTEIV